MPASMPKMRTPRCACWGAPLDALDVAREGAAQVVEVGEDEGARLVKAARDDVLDVLHRQALGFLQLQVPGARCAR